MIKLLTRLDEVFPRARTADNKDKEVYNTSISHRNNVVPIKRTIVVLESYRLDMVLSGCFRVHLYWYYIESIPNDTLMKYLNYLN
jgi:hypothetical protein